MNEYKLQRAAAGQVKDTDTDTNCRHNNRYKVWEALAMFVYIALGF